MKKFIILLILAILVAVILWTLKITFISQSGSGIVKQFDIKEGVGVHQISHDLKKAKLIDSSFVFETYLWFIHGGNKILAGQHSINDKWSARTLCRALITGSDLENETTIKILEGWDLRDIADYFEKQGIAKQEDFYDIVGTPTINYDLNKSLEKPVDFSTTYPILSAKPKNYSYEGFLFPDTYRIFKNSSVKVVVEKMISNFQKKISSQMISDMNAAGRNLYDVITLASIIEKEEKSLEDKKIVAGIYYNRLKIGMALQADPTVNYITGKQSGGPSQVDLESKNLYNTYKYRGLPPGPICNPGLDSIMAAIYPTKSSYLYFYNGPDGKLYSAKTLEEHNNNIWLHH
ncbi:MAG: endolytic transglycosylase MltG [Patescibacteria group bacterium]|nr:endolytic transglycosylase MltG [Patescibacteria group bacterium]